MKTGVYLALAALALAGCTPVSGRADGGDGTDGTGPARILSLNPCADAVLAQVAGPDQILALSHYSHDPRATSMDIATARRFAVTGGTVEEILALSPDVVVAGTFLPPTTAQALSRLGIRVERLPIARNVPESMAQLRHLAELAGQAERGKALIGQIEAALAAAAPPAGHRPVAAVIWQSGGIVPGRDELVSDLLARTGFASHSAARGLGQAAYLPLEAMLTDPPQVILTAGTPGDGEDRMLAHPALDALAGVRKERFAPDLLYCGGPTIIRAAQRLAQVRRTLAS